MRSRQKVGNKDAIWLFAGGALQEITARKIRERGFRLIVTDVNPRCACASHTDELVNLDTFDIKGNLKEADRLRGKYRIKAVLTTGADCHETVAHTARRLGLHGINPKISHLCRFKLESRQILTKAGIPQPSFRGVKTIGGACSAAKEIGLPVALKSTDNSGSRGFSRIERMEDLTADAFTRAVENGTTGYAIVEKLLMPIRGEIAEQSVETLWYDGKMYWLNWVDRLFRKDLSLFGKIQEIRSKFYSNVGWSVELAHINPALHSFQTKQEVREMIYQAGLAIGMGNEKGGHILKADIMLTEDGPYILELTLRLSGGWDSSMTTPLRGADFVGGAISLAMGEGLDIDLWHRYFHYADPGLFTSVVAAVTEDARDCIGRRFSCGIGYDRESSLRDAYRNLAAGKFL